MYNNNNRLVGTPSGGIYSGISVTGNMFTISTAGTFSPAYSFTDSVTGFANTVSTSIVVSICTGLTSNGLPVHPNPNHSEFTIELNNGLNKSIDVTEE